MNRWECQHHGCTSTAVGCGGATGLQAIGWYFAPGPVIYCPIHNPNRETPDPRIHDTDDHAPCALCYSERQARTIQSGQAFA